MILQDLVKSADALKHLSQEKINAVISFRLATLIEKVEQELKRYQTVQDEKLKQYGELVENKDGNSYQLSGENLTKFQSERTDLLNEEIELNFTKIKLEDIKNINLSINHMVSLKWLIEE